MPVNRVQSTEYRVQRPEYRAYSKLPPHPLTLIYPPPSPPFAPSLHPRLPPLPLPRYDYAVEFGNDRGREVIFGPLTDDSLRREISETIGTQGQVDVEFWRRPETLPAGHRCASTVDLAANVFYPGKKPFSYYERSSPYGAQRYVEESWTQSV